MRALAGQADLHWRGQRVYQGRRALPAFGPHLQPSAERDDFASLRGATDGIALRLARSNAALHRTLAPADPLERAIFDLLEQLRVEALAPAAMPGLARNLAHRFRRWSEAFVGAGGTESRRGIVLFALAQTVRSRLTAQPLPEHMADLIETTRGRLAGHIGHELAALRRHGADQRAFAPHARAVAKKVAALLAGDDDEAGAGADPRDEDDARSGFARLMGFGGEWDDEAGSDEPDRQRDGLAPGESASRRGPPDAAGGYRVYTRAHDREVQAATLVRAAQLTEYRERLDGRIAAQGLNAQRLARQLQALLATPRADGWEGGLEEGRIDGRRLAALVASPTERRLFRAERIEPLPDAIVTFLIDCSGSMKACIEPVAMIVDVFARALDAAGIASEVLGFTTGAWSGGRAHADWLRAGRPPRPGRLSELRHLVFKSADTPWRRARRGIAALLKTDQFREGVDGEAVQWALARLQRRPERRRILLVVSDGGPMDTATLLANDAHILDQHLRDVVQRQTVWASARSAGNAESAALAEIAGIGVGLDLSPYYPRCQALDLDAPPGNRVFQEILELIAGRHRR
ncbi:MAG: cobalt chelatase [Rubrivivax sp.]|nr:cobalt chelatase [Rubrivivax sp.]